MGWVAIALSLIYGIGTVAADGYIGGWSILLFIVGAVTVAAASVRQRMKDHRDYGRLDDA